MRRTISVILTVLWVPSAGINHASACCQVPPETRPPESKAVFICNGVKDPKCQVVPEPRPPEKPRNKQQSGPPAGSPAETEPAGDKDKR
jgi:hypothetical protein